MNAFIIFLIAIDLMVIIACITCILVPRVLRHFWWDRRRKPRGKRGFTKKVK